MGTSSTGAARPPRKSRKLATFVVIDDGEIVFTSDVLSSAAAWRDGRGSGEVYERVTTN